MDKILLLAEEISQELEEIPLVKEYLVLRKNIENNEDLQDLRKKIKVSLQHGDKKTYQELLHEYETHPLVSNLKILHEEVEEILKFVKNTISA